MIHPTKNPTLPIRLLAGMLLLFFLFILFVFISSFYESKPEAKASIIAALISVAGLIWSKYAEKIKEIENSHRIEKAKFYEKFTDLLFKQFLISEKAKNTPISEAKLFEELADFRAKLIIWGSSDAINAYITFLSESRHPEKVLLAGQNLLAAIRKDLGHQDKFKKNEILKYIINQEDHHKLDTIIR